MLAIKPADGFANLVLAVQSIKKADYATAEQQLGQIGGDNQLGPLREYVMAWLKAGEKDFAAARARLAKLKAAGVQRRRRRRAWSSRRRSTRWPATRPRRKPSIAAPRRSTRRPAHHRAVAEGLRRLGKADEARETC